ncbi:MAG: hypothetical protein ACE5HN_00370 [Nitrospiria bacterium]
MSHTFYSVRTGKNKNIKGFGLPELKVLFLRTYNNLCEQGYFSEYLGWYCVDMGEVQGKVIDVELEILLKVRKQDLWPIHEKVDSYSEDDLFDMIEFLYQNVSKPIDGTHHSYSECGMHWETFNRNEGKSELFEKFNELLSLYQERFELSKHGEILQKPEQGFEQIFEADVPSKDNNVKSRIGSAILRYRRHGSTIDDRRQAVRDLADVLEYLRPKVKSLLTKQDEKDLFNLANNFGIRHHNDQQKTNYDTALWLSWMFYYYLATIHVILRKMANEELNK